MSVRVESEDSVVLPVPDSPKNRATSPLSPSFAEQCIDFYTVPNVQPTAALFPVVKKETDAGRGSNTKGSDNIITNGSKIVVPEGYGLITLQDGEITGFVAEPAKLVGLFDVFALSSHSEQFPISLVEAMAAGLPVAAPRVGDVSAMVASDNGPFLCEPGDEAALAKSVGKLAADPVLRKRIGEANRAKAVAEFDEQAMIERYRSLYWGLIGRD